MKIAFSPANLANPGPPLLFFMYARPVLLRPVCAHAGHSCPADVFERGERVSALGRSPLGANQAFRHRAEQRRWLCAPAVAQCFGGVPPGPAVGLYSTAIGSKSDGVTPRAPSPLSASPGLGHAVTIPGARERETAISSGMMHDQVAVADQVIARRPSTKRFDEHHTRRNREARASKTGMRFHSPELD